MDPSVLRYVYIYGTVVVLVILYLMWRPIKSGGRLKFRDMPNSKALDLKTAPIDFKNAPEHSRREERDLNIIFQYNGHDFDAYEVFGLPAGTNLDIVEQTFEFVVSNSERESRPFYEAALKAVRQRFNKRK